MLGISGVLSGHGVRGAAWFACLLLLFPMSSGLLCTGLSCLDKGTVKIKLKPNISDVYIDKKLKVALITAGHIRSFAIVAQSWKRYLLADPQADIHLFAVVSAQLHEDCDLMPLGLEMLRHMASDMEVSYSSTPETDADYIKSRLKANSNFQCSNTMTRFAAAGDKKIKGNFIDMHLHRSRAYRLSEAYSNRHKLTWDLIMFGRLDNAYYAPMLSFPLFHQVLTERSSLNGTKNIIINKRCNFGGFCDRFAVGFPREMALYFKKDWVFDLHNSHIDLRGDPEALQRIDTAMNSVVQFRCNSESFLRAWIWGYHNITALYIYDALNFITLRTTHATLYCQKNRAEITDLKKPLVPWMDSMSAMFDPRYAEDALRDPVFRCGNAIVEKGIEVILNCSSKADGLRL